MGLLRPLSINLSSTQLRYQRPITLTASMNTHLISRSLQFLNFFHCVFLAFEFIFNEWTANNDLDYDAVTREDNRIISPVFLHEFNIFLQWRIQHFRGVHLRPTALEMTLGVRDMPLQLRDVYCACVVFWLKHKDVTMVKKQRFKNLHYTRGIMPKRDRASKKRRSDAEPLATMRLMARESNPRPSAPTATCSAPTCQSSNDWFSWF